MTFRLTTPEAIKTSGDLNELATSIREDTDAVRRERTAREYIETAYVGKSAPPEDMRALVHETLRLNSSQYRSLITFHGGDLDWIAGKVVDHMLNGSWNGDSMVLERAIMDLESLAAEIMNTPMTSWEDPDIG